MAHLCHLPCCPAANPCPCDVIIGQYDGINRPYTGHLATFAVVQFTIFARLYWPWVDSPWLIFAPVKFAPPPFGPTRDAYLHYSPKNALLAHLPYSPKIWVNRVIRPSKCRGR